MHTTSFQRIKLSFQTVLFAFLIPGRGRDFFLRLCIETDFVPTQPPIKWEPGALSQWAKRPRLQDDHSPPCRAEVKSVDLYLHSPIRLHDVVLD
jgi:hypothetical protein